MVPALFICRRVSPLVLRVQLGTTAAGANRNARCAHRTHEADLDSRVVMLAQQATIAQLILVPLFPSVLADTGVRQRGKAAALPVHLAHDVAVWKNYCRACHPCDSPRLAQTLHWCCVICRSHRSSSTMRSWYVLTGHSVDVHHVQCRQLLP